MNRLRHWLIRLGGGTTPIDAHILRTTKRSAEMKCNLLKEDVENLKRERDKLLTKVSVLQLECIKRFQAMDRAAEAIKTWKEHEDD